MIPLTLLINVYIIVFYNSVGVSLSFISFFQIFARSFDVLTDPLMAHISDNLTHTKRGRRIPYMMLCPLYSIAFFILVSPPLNSSDAATYWFGGSYLFFYLCDTLVNVPFQALGPELTDDTDKRSELYMFVKLAEGIGIIVGTLTPSILGSLDISDAAIYQGIAIFFGTWYIVSMYALISRVKERPASMIQTTELRQPFVTSLFRSIRNKAFRPLMIGWVLDFASLALIATMLPFFLKYYVELDDANTVLGFAMAAFFVSGFCAIPIFFYLSRQDRQGDEWYEKLKIGKFNAWLTYNVINVCTNFLFLFIGEGDLYYMYFCMIMNGIPTGGQFLIASVLCDVIDYDEFLNFKRNEGQFSVFATFIPKLIAIPCQSFPLVGMFLLGYIDPPKVDPNDDDAEEIFIPQNVKVKWFIRVFFVLVPLTFVSLSFLIKRTFPIKKAQMMADIAEGITKHLQGKPAIDPLTNKEVWIEEMDDQQQYLIYLMDQFTHDQLLWLLSPDEIFKRHVQHGIPLRKNTLQHITLTGKSLNPDHFDDDNENNENENKNNDEMGSKQKSDSVKNTDEEVTRPASATAGRTGSLLSRVSKRKLKLGFCDGAFDCFKSEKELYPETMEAGNVKFGKNDAGEIVYVSVSKYEAHGIDRGTRRLQRRMLYWVIIWALCAFTSLICVIFTWPLLSEPDYAFIPAVFCLCIGLCTTGSGFSFLRSKAAKEIRHWVEKHNLSSEMIARCIYPKTKGQRGGASLAEEDLGFIDQMVPRATAEPQQLRSLRDVHALVHKSENYDDSQDTNLYD